MVSEERQTDEIESRLPEWYRILKKLREEIEKEASDRKK